MAVRSICLLGNPVLRELSRPVADPASDEAKSLITDLRDTLFDFRSRRGFGRGIAAPQIGVSLRMIYVHMPEFWEGPMIDPKITWESDERFELWDDCFSFPDLMVKVARAVSVHVHCRDASGQIRTVEADRRFSELLQHEIDHLNGILAVDRAVSRHAFALRSEWERFHRTEPPAR